MNILDRLRKAKTPPKEEETVEEPEERISERELTKRLESFLYSEDIVQDYLPVFRKLYQDPEFSKVMQIIEAKESELNSINGSKEYFEQVTEPDETTSETTEEGNEDYLMTILNERYGE